MFDSKKLKQRFVKDNSIPINIFQEPYFSEKLKTLREYDNWNNFIEEISKIFKSEEEYFDYCDKVINEAIDSIKNKEAYEDFLGLKNDDYPLFNVKRSKDNIYKKPNLGKRILSIDLKEANFSSLKYFDKNLVNNKESYEEFIKEFTDIYHIQKSKHIRQIIFGHLNMKRQGLIQKHLIGKFIPIVLSELLSQDDYDKETKKDPNGKNLVLLNYMNNEITFDISNFDQELVDKTIDAIKKYSELLEVKVGIDVYTLKEIKRIIKKNGREEVQETKFYLKSFDNGDFELKCVDSLVYCMVLKSIRNEEITEYDKAFFTEEHIAKIIEDIRYILV